MGVRVGRELKRAQASLSGTLFPCRLRPFDQVLDEVNDPFLAALGEEDPGQPGRRKEDYNDDQREDAECPKNVLGADQLQDVLHVGGLSWLRLALPQGSLGEGDFMAKIQVRTRAVASANVLPGPQVEIHLVCRSSCLVTDIQGAADDQGSNLRR